MSKSLICHEAATGLYHQSSWHTVLETVLKRYKSFTQKCFLYLCAPLKTSIRALKCVCSLFIVYKVCLTFVVCIWNENDWVFLYSVAFLFKTWMCSTFLSDKELTCVDFTPLNFKYFLLIPVFLKKNYFTFLAKLWHSKRHRSFRVL